METAAVMQAWASVGGVLATLVVGAAQFFLIWAGLKQMRAASVARDRQMDAQLEALSVLIERTGGRGKP